ncbi:hypothetical protein N7540_000659 [Penicillium herquei]|nr:hypothetical protein N7540_000659 [Penicillium herquei]
MAWSQGEMTALGFVFVVLATTVVGLRIWARRLCGAILAADDYAIFLGWGFTISVCIIHLIATFRGELGQHQATYPNGEPILDDPRFIIYEKCKFALHMLSVLGLGTTKISIILLYRRIFRTPVFQRICLVYLGVVVAWTIAFFFACLFQCTPVTPFVEGFYGNKCTNVLVLYNAVGGSDVALDVFIIILPIQPVLRLKMDLRRRLAVLGMFLLGLLAVACSIARLVSFIQCDTVLIAHYNDETYYTSGVFVWTVIELVMAVVSACLPTLRPLFMMGKKEPSAQYPSDYSDRRKMKYGWMGSADSQSVDFGDHFIESQSRDLPLVHSQTEWVPSFDKRPGSEDGIYIEQSLTWTHQDTIPRPRQDV